MMERNGQTAARMNEGPTGDYTTPNPVNGPPGAFPYYLPYPQTYPTHGFHPSVPPTKL